MKKIKNHDIAILLFSLLVFSLGVGWIYSKSNTKVEPKKKEQAIKTMVKDAPEIPEPPKEIKHKESDIPKKEKLLTIDEMLEYVKEWATESGVPTIIEFLKTTCPKDKVVQMIQKIIKKYAQELTRENKVKLILSLAHFYKKDKAIQHKLFELLSAEKTIEQGDVPLIFIAAQLEETEVLPAMVDWYKSQKNRKLDLEKRTFDYAAKHDYVDALKKLQEKLKIIDPAYATQLLWILVQANTGTKSIKFLRKLGADVDYQDPKTKFTLLIKAIKNKNLDTVKELVEPVTIKPGLKKLGANVNKASENKAIGYPVQNAREIGRTDIEMFLRSKGATD